MAGTSRRVLRIVSVAAAVVLVASGCGGSPRPHSSAGRLLPHTLAKVWAGRASAIANAEAAGDGCTALQLANSLRQDIQAKQASVPASLRSPLVSGVNALVDSLTCTRTVTVQTTPGKPPHKKHGHHGNGGDNGDQG